MRKQGILRPPEPRSKTGFVHIQRLRIWASVRAYFEAPLLLLRKCLSHRLLSLLLSLPSLLMRLLSLLPGLHIPSLHNTCAYYECFCLFHIRCHTRNPI